MALPAPNLDDRTFQDIVDEAKRLIPRYTPEWTNHNLSDPGVALIELFAWMSEMVLFRVNQVPDRLFVHFLNLVGIEPFPPSVARADVTFWLSAAQDFTVTVPDGMQVTTGRDIAGERPIVFTTVSALDIRPPDLVAALSTDAKSERLTDVMDDLRYEGSSVTCFSTLDGSGNLVPGDALLLGFARSLAGVALRLSVAAVAQGIGVDPLRPPLAWEVWNGEAWIAADVFSDSTGGLNRSGEIVLMVPNEHELLTLGNRWCVLGPGPADQTTARPTGVPGVAHRRRSQGGDHRCDDPCRTCIRLTCRGARTIRRQPRPGVPGDVPAGPAAAAQ